MAKVFKLRSFYLFKQYAEHNTSIECIEKYECSLQILLIYRLCIDAVGIRLLLYLFRANNWLILRRL